jgi:excinuclease ABC subunit C
MVVFEDALPRKQEYRQFGIADATDDLTAMREVLTRRFTRYLEQAALPPDEREKAKFAYPPQLVVVDGGPGQVEAAVGVLSGLGIDDVEVVGLAKRLEEVWQPGQAYPAILPRGSEALYLLQRIRDEAHRFAIGAHRKKRGKAMTASAVEDIPGVGPSRAKALLRHFGSLPKLRAASVDQIAMVPGVGNAMARHIHASLHGLSGTMES